MQREERDVPEGPARVLAVGCVSAVLALAGQLHRLHAQTDVTLEEHLAQLCKTFERIVGTRLGPVAVDPLVVARRIDERMPRALRKGEAGVGSRAAARRQAPAPLRPRP